MATAIVTRTDTSATLPHPGSIGFNALTCPECGDRSGLLFSDERCLECELEREEEGKRPGPDPAWVRGSCPLCAAPLVVNAYWEGGRGYVLWKECWQALGEAPTCAFRAVIR